MELFCLPTKVREQIALIAAETNGCDYCASAHTALGKHAGLGQDEINKALEDRATDPKADTASASRNYYWRNMDTSVTPISTR